MGQINSDQVFFINEREKSLLFKCYSSHFYFFSSNTTKIPSTTTLIFTVFRRSKFLLFSQLNCMKNKDKNEKLHETKIKETTKSLATQSFTKTTYHSLTIDNHSKHKNGISIKRNVI